MTKLLVIKPSSLGDVIHGLPALRLIRQRLGTELERVSWVVNDSFASLLDLAPDVDRIIPFPRKTMWQRGKLAAFKKELQAESYDVSIDFQGLLRSGIMSWLSHAPRRIGFADGRECSPLFYNQAIRIPRGHAVGKNLKLASVAFPLPGTSCTPDDEVTYPQGSLLMVPEEERQQARKLLGGGNGPFLAVGHSSRWNSKNWPIPFFAAVLDDLALRQEHLIPWLLGSPEEAARAQAVADACKVAKPLNLAGKTNMRGLVGLLSLSGCLLTNDSGPMHLAAALDIPTVALFGATDPKLTGPYGPPGRHRVFRTLCPQGPCFKHECPFGPNHCSQGIDPHEVASSVLSALSLPLS